MELEEILRKSSFVIHDDIFFYAKSKTIPKSKEYFMVSQDTDEVTIVAKKEDISKFDIYEEKTSIF